MVVKRAICAFVLMGAGLAIGQTVLDGSGAAIEKGILGRMVATVSHELRDPTSAQFRNIRRSKLAGTYCGEVNGKNGFGAYAGFTPFLYREARLIPAPAEDPGPGRQEPASATVLDKKAERNLMALTNMPLAISGCTTDQGDFIVR